MHGKAQKLFYALSIFLLMTAIFILRPSEVPEVTSLQKQMKQQFSIAWQQTMGDASYFDGLDNVYRGVQGFYIQAADSTIALLAQPDRDAEIYYVFGRTYQILADVFKDPAPTVAVSKPQVSEERVLGVSEPSVMAVNRKNSWVTMQDNSTGQLYCVAIYNSEVNKYLGPCKDRIYSEIH
jgi:hypothetical protein